ncbi:hypothetical protein [Caulobacter mirabilis]|uniref:Uncharacterized protein n=1 Tax=Caulobacter mirabilis TaxID=69666 RepID=A0A2D2B147_9CAUL|nr:hypothetical protein [Caulobacter mirabilis]ATQ43927.1 hypothetical protein CSW64_16780 [Caulobacter mirabilis]
MPGVCQADVAVFEFHPVGPATRPGDVPTRLVGITAETGYRLLRPAGVALAAFEKADDEDRLPESPLDFPDTAACERLAAEEAAFTRADSPADFLENMALLEKIGTTLRDGGSLEIVCDFAPDRAPAACRKVILAFPETPVIEIQSCDETPAPRTSCVRFEDWNGGLNVHLRQTGGAPEITRVHRPEPPIIMAHPRRD